MTWQELLEKLQTLSKDQLKSRVFYFHQDFQEIGNGIKFVGDWEEFRENPQDVYIDHVKGYLAKDQPYLIVS